MDPLVFSISTTSSGPGSGTQSTISEHPGETAPPLKVIEWLDVIDEVLNITSYGAVRAGDIPASLLRSTGSVSLDTMPSISQGDGITHADVARREKERALTIAENTRKGVERAATMRDYKNRIAAMLQKAMRETALTKLKALQAAHVDASNGKMFDGPAMLDAMRASANAELAAGDDETERLALSELEGWKARAPPGGCSSGDMVKHWNYFQLHINPYLAQPMAGKVLSDMLVSQLSAHGISSDVRRVKASLQAANTYNTTSAVITAFAKLLGPKSTPNFWTGGLGRAAGGMMVEQNQPTR